MKHIKFLSILLALSTILLGACGSINAPTASQGAAGPKVDAPVVFTGAVESISGNEWVVNGQTITVDPSVVQDGSVQIGDTIKVEAVVQADGSITALKVELPSAADPTTSATQLPAPTSASTGTAIQNLVFNDSGDEAFGTVDAVTYTSITVGGQTFNFAPGAEIKGEIAAGAFVKLHFIANPDGSLAVREVEISDPSQIGNDNGNNDNSNDANVNDDNSNDANVNDDNSNDANVNDDNGGNANDDNGGNSNDDSGANGNDDNGGGGNDNGGGGSDDGGGNENGGG